MFDENEHIHPQNNDEGPRHIHRGIKRSEPDEVEVDSADFFSPEPPRPKAPTPPSEPPKPPVPPRRQWEPLHPSEPAPADDKLPKGGMVLLVLQAILSLAALVQLWRTQMLPVLYLVIITALLVLLWLLVRKCLASRSGAVVARVLSVLLCAALAVGCVWAQQGLTALDSMTSGLLTGAEANKITKEPFVVYLSGVDNRGELTEKARSDVNILAVVNPTTKQVALINTPRDYYVDLAGTDSKDKLTHAGLYGVETSMATLGNLYGVDVEHYLRINFAGFINIIDAIGGVDVYSDQAFTSVGSPGYYDPTTFAEGWNHLDRRHPARHQPDESHRRDGQQAQIPGPAHGLLQADGRRRRLLRHQPLAGTDLCAGPDAAGRPCQLGHPELHRHRLGREEQQVLLRQGPEPLRHEAG